ncbi:MAG: cohesin domain-containing protein [Bacteroidetes bacterium]|nr:cohesin domain-containing protein [Bacteroidota bacterium]
MNKRTVLTLVILCLLTILPGLLAAQSITTTLVSASKCPGEIAIPLRVTNCAHIGAFSLVFSYNTSVLTYLGYQNLHPQLSGGTFSVNAYNGKVYFTWASVTPANIAADTLIKIRFTGVTGSSALTWDTQVPGNCEYSDSTGTIKTSAYTNGTATVYQVPGIATQPVNASVTAGQNTSFSVGAAATGIVYQWQVSTNGGSTWTSLTNGTNYSNVTGASLNVLAAPIGFTGYRYRCIVSGTCSPAVTSSTAILTVSPVPQVIATTAGSVNICPGNVIIPLTVSGFTAVGSFSLALGYGTGTLAFSGVQNANSALAGGTLTANAYNGKVYLTWASVVSATIATGGTLAELVFSGTTGSSTLSWDTQTPGNCEYSDGSGTIISSTYTGGSMSFYAPPTITTQPVDKTITQSQNTSFSVGASGTGLTYQWQSSTNGGLTWSNLTNVAPYSNVTAATLNITAATLAMTGYRYRCTVSGTCPSPATTASAMLTVNPTPQVITATVGTKTVCPGAILVPVYAVNFNSVGSFSMTIAYNMSVLTYVDVVNRHSAISGGTFSANAANGKVYVTWANTSPATVGNDTLFRISFTAPGGSSALTWDITTPGACEITDGSGVAITTNYTNGTAGFYLPPAITGQPADKAVTEGQAATFSVGAGATGIIYQWKGSTNGGSTWTSLTNTAPYSGVTSATLTVSNTTTVMSGYKYFCMVSGTCSPAASSTVATLTVTAAPQVIQVTAKTVSSSCAGLIRQPVYATGFNGVAAMSLVLKYDTNTLRYIGLENPNAGFNSTYFQVNNYKGKIYVVWASGTAISLGNDTLFRLKFDCSGGNVTNTWDTQTAGNCEITNAGGSPIQATYTNGTVTVTPSCNFTDLPTGYWAYNEIQYLCGRGIVSGSSCKVYPDSLLKRQQLAKIAFLGLLGNVSVVSDAFPSPFNDLQNTGTYYYRYAKALSYLEYNDGISPFDRNRFNFNPEEKIVRVLVLKVLLETFNIPPDETGPSPFTDIGPGDPFYGYVKEAADRGIISTANPLFRPLAYCTRAEAFVMLERTIHSNPLVTIPTVSNTLNPGTSSFFIPGNYTPYNFSSMVGAEQGNFNHYTKSSFKIPGKGIPLNFDHNYNSFLTELPDEFVPMSPLGAGWSHSYNAYIINTIEVKDDYGQTIGKPCLIVFWPDGTMNVYDNTGTPANPAPVTFGVYDQLTRVSSSVYTVLTKTQLLYTFTKINGSATGAPYVLTAIADRNGNTSNLSYAIGVDNMPRISMVKDPLNRQLTFAYQAGTNYISSITDPLNRQVKFTVTNKQLATFTDANSHVTSYGYDPATPGKYLLTTIQLPKGNTITNLYLQRKLISSKFNNNSPLTISQAPNYVSGTGDYNKSTVVVPQATGQSVTTNFEFNRNGSATKVYGNSATNFTSQYTSNTDPLLPMAVTNNNNGMAVNNTYDARGNIIQVARSGSGMTTTHEYFEYNLTNDITRRTDANGNSTSYTYDPNGNLLQVTDPLGKETVVTYNSSGQPLTMTNPNGITTQFGYSNTTGMQNTFSIPALSLSSAMNFDLSSRLLSVSDFKGDTTKYQYDYNDNLVWEKNALNHTTTYSYDANDNLVTITNAKNGVTTMTYDTATDLLLKQTFQGNSRIYTYNYDGSLKTTSDPNGNLFTYTYDNAGRVTNDGYAAYSFYSNGNLQSITRAGKSVTFTYDGFNRVSTVAYDGFTVGYTYDNGGNITKLIYPGNKTVTYTYDASNRMQSVTDWINQATLYNYRDDGSLLSTVYPNGVITAYAYDPAGRQAGLASKRANGSVIAEYSYLLDKLGNHTLENIAQPVAVNPSLAKPLINYTYNAANRILTADTTSFGYDFNGNTLSKTGYTYGYDLKNNLISVSGRFNANYSYDGAGLRRESSCNGTVKKYVLDVLGISKVLMETNVNGTPLNYYVYGLGLIARIKPDNTTGYYISDFRGSTVAMVDGTSAAAITHQYAYDDFGTITKSVETDFNPFRYIGKYGVMYEDSSLVFMRSRYYDNTIGRFLTEDPIWNKNLYPYAENNPTNLIDPMGQSDVFLDLTAFYTDQKLNNGKDLEDISAYDYAKYVTSQLINQLGPKLAAKVPVNTLFGLTRFITKAFKNKKNLSAQDVADLIEDVTTDVANILGYLVGIEGLGDLVPFAVSFVGKIADMAIDGILVARIDPYKYLSPELRRKLDKSAKVGAGSVAPVNPQSFNRYIWTGPVK